MLVLQQGFSPVQLLRPIAVDVVQLLPELAANRASRLSGRIRRGTELALLRRWAGLLAIAVQRAVAQSTTRSFGANLCTGSLLEPPMPLAELMRR